MNIRSIFLQTLVLALLAVLCASCGNKKSVPILNRSKAVYNKSGANKIKYAEAKSKNENIAKNNETKTNLKNENSHQANEIEVGNGDTLYSIAKKYQTPLRDIIEANKLDAPYNLKAGTKITIPQPTYYQVKNGDTLYSVSRDLQMNINDIIALNNLQAPYKLNAGQLIKVKNDDAKKDNIKAVKNTQTNHETAPEVVSKDLPTKSEPEKIIEHKNNKFAWPIKGPIVSKFGPKKGGLYNDGINIKAKEGSIIKASEDGFAAYVGNELKGYGNLVIIKHSDGWITAYAHLSKFLVKRGDKIKKGQNIGAVGSSGNVDSAQLYFGLRKGRDAVNPENYLK